MNLFEEAVIYATVMHAGKTRKRSGAPYILHPLEVAQIISTMTDDLEVITAGLLHDIVEDTDGTIDEIANRFGQRVADLVASETENKYHGQDKSVTWKKRKEETLKILKTTNDIGVKMLWLGDKLSNIRSLARDYSVMGAETWTIFNQKDPLMQKWYYQSVAELIELDLNRTGAFKEYIRHINSIWPGTIDSEKAKYKKYKEISVEGCKVIGKGAKGTVYRYDDELIIKVYNENNLFKEIERENALSRKAFVAGIPTAISFGIVTVGQQYGSMFELLDSDSVSNLIAKNLNNLESYANAMADLALQIHSTEAKELELPDYMPEVRKWISEGVENLDRETADRVCRLLDALPETTTMIHGDFHTGNVMEQKGELLLIDMDRLSYCHPIVELSGIYLFYCAFGEWMPAIIEGFMGFSYEAAKEFELAFMKRYLKTEDMSMVEDLNNKAAVLAYARLVRRYMKKGINASYEEQRARDFFYGRLKEVLDKVDSLDF